MARPKRYYSIKFPLTCEDNNQRFLFDLNTNKYESLKSDIVHLIFTPTGQRLRNPRFGSNLIKMLFMPNDELTHSQIKQEIQDSIKMFIPAVNITEVKGEVDETGRGYILNIDYTVNEGGFLVNDNINITV